jgi:hypothetical protein
MVKSVVCIVHVPLSHNNSMIGTDLVFPFEYMYLPTPACLPGHSVRSV